MLKRIVKDIPFSITYARMQKNQKVIYMQYRNNKHAIIKQ